MKRSTLFAVLVALASVVIAAPAWANYDLSSIDDFEDGDIVGWNWAEDLHNGWLDPVELDGANVGRITFGSSCYGPSYQLTEAITPDYIGWRMRANGDTGHLSGAGLRVATREDDAGRLITVVNYHDATLQFHDGTGYEPFMAAAQGTWYQVEIRNIDWETHQYELVVDDLSYGMKPFVEPVDSFSYVQAYGCPWVNGPLYLDDIVYGYAIPDSDVDGVLDTEDECPGTTLGDPPDRLKKNRFAATTDGLFVDADGTDSGFSIVDTRGCDEDQIIEIMELGNGHTWFGITQGALIDFKSAS